MYPSIHFHEREELDRVLALLSEKLQPKAVYCFAHQKQLQSSANAFNAEPSHHEHNHFFLLIIMQSVPGNAAADTADYIKTKTAGECTATLLMHSAKALATKNKDKQFFFYDIMHRGCLVYANPENAPFIIAENEPQRNWESSMRYWNQRLANAENAIEAAVLLPDNGSPVKAFLLHLATEQICLGLIRIFLGYTPNHHAIGFLMELCGTFTEMPSGIFPRKTREDKNLFRLLSMSPTHLRLRTPDYDLGTDLDILDRRCTLLLMEATQLVAAHLELNATTAISN